jgi:hypothetical protein
VGEAYDQPASDAQVQAGSVEISQPATESDTASGRLQAEQPQGGQFSGADRFQAGGNDGEEIFRMFVIHNGSGII